MSLDYWYDYGYYDYGYSDLSVDGLLGGLDSLFGDLFYDDYYYSDYDYGYGYDDYDYDYGFDDVISVDGLDSLSGLDDISVDSIFGLLDGIGLDLGVGGLLGGLDSLFGDLFYDDSFYAYGYDYGYDNNSDYGNVISVDGTDSLGDLSALGDLSGLDLSLILGLLGGSGLDLSVDGGSDLSSILNLLGGGTDASDLSLILSLLGGAGLDLSVDGGSDLSSILSLLGGGTDASDLSSILSLLGGSGLDLSVDGGSSDSDALLSALGLLGGSGTGSLPVTDESGSDTSALDTILNQLDGFNSETIVNVEGGSAAVSGTDLSSILSLLGGSSSTDASSLSSILGLLGGGTDTSALSSILGLLGGSGTTLSVDGLSGLSSSLNSLMSMYSGIANLENGDTASWEDLSFLDNLNNVLPNVSGSTVTDSSSLLSSILGMLGGSGGTNVSVTGGTAASSNGIDLSSILALLGGSGSTNVSVEGGTAASSNGIDLSSILGMLGGSGTTLSTDGLDLSSILGLLGGSGTTLSTDGLDLSSILGLLGGSGTTLSTDGLDLSSILGLLGGSGTTLSTDGLDLSSILGLLGGSDTALSVGGLDFSSLLTSVRGMLDGFDMSLIFADDSFGVTVELPDMLALDALQPMSLLSWSGADESDLGYWIEIARGDVFDDAIRMFTSSTAFDVDGSSGAFSCRATLKDYEFLTDAVEWVAEVIAEPRQIISNANGIADIFFASPLDGDVWGMGYCARNAITGETALVTRKNRIRDTFSGSDTDANILFLTDSVRGDALFLDDVYSEFGDDARLDLIREIRCGAGGDVIDMTSDSYSAGLAGLTVRGGSGNDVLWGANGGNLLFGDDGWDRIIGGAGDDIIAGGTGDDTLNGGGGSDLFVFGGNWGDDSVTQINGGSIALWFLNDEAQISVSELDGDVIFRNEAGTASVTVRGAALADLTVRFGDDGSEQFARLSAAGAFLGSTTESVFETQDARTNGVLASL